MKNIKLLIALLSLMVMAQITVAQNPVTMLQHAGDSTPYYGIDSFIAAVTAAVNGDTLYLSAGVFNAPTIDKGIKVFGSGNFPDVDNVKKRTSISGDITINAGADSLHLEGLFLNVYSGIDYAAASSINNVKVVRCRIYYMNFNSNSEAASKNFCSVEECFIETSIDFNRYGTNLLVKHCMLGQRISNINGNALIDGNIFLYSSSALSSITSSLIQNNIFINLQNYPLITNCGPNNFLNNLFAKSTVDFGTNSSYENNYLNIPQADIFVNQSGTTINYADDYHLQNPELYLGTDGTQVGIYGGSSPFKEKGLPSNPQVTAKTIAKEIDTNGNLQINITVETQDY